MPRASAIAFARRKRLGPFALSPPADRRTQDRAFAAMLRAGHDLDRTRRVLTMTPDDVARYEAESGEIG